VLLAAALLSVGAGSVADTLQQLQQRFDRESDAVRKAKQLRKLASAQFDKERESAKSGDYSGVGLEMEKYRDNVRAALEALKKARPDAEKHSAGYRELEMQVGQGIREIRNKAGMGRRDALVGWHRSVPRTTAAQDFTARGCADHFERDVFSALSRSQFVRGRDSPASPPGRFRRVSC